MEDGLEQHGNYSRRESRKKYWLSFCLTGRVLGIRLSVEEVVTERNPPRSKVWKTVGLPRLLVIGHYRMGFEISTQGDASLLRVFIDYALPDAAPARWLGLLFGRFYAKWCVAQMIDGALNHFIPPVTGNERPSPR